MIEPLSTEKVIVKHELSSFYDTALQEELKKQGITKLVVCGMMTHMCVDTTVRAAKDLGYEVSLIADACATKSLNWMGESISADVVQKVYLASLEGGFADVIDYKTYLRKALE